MTRDEIKDLSKLLTNIPVDPDTITRFVDDIFFELALRSDAQMLRAAIKAITSGTSTYDFQDDMIRLFASFYDDEMLSMESEAGLNAYADTWPADSGTPKALTQDEITARTYTLYPVPDTTSDALIPIHGEPYGEDYPANSLILIYADERQTDISDIYSLPIAFDGLAREFSFPSDHTDMNFSKNCTDVAQLLYGLIGIK